MTYLPIPQRINEELEKYIKQETLLPAVHFKIADFDFNMPYAVESIFNKLTATTPGTWVKADKSLPSDEANYEFEPVTDYLYATSAIIRIPRPHIEMSVDNGIALDQEVVTAVMNQLNKDLETFVIKGPYVNGSYLTTAGLWNKAGQTSTYSTLKFGAASGAYEHLRDMKHLAGAQGVDISKPLIAVLHTTIFPFVDKLPATDASFSEKTRIEEELLNGGMVIQSDKMPAAASHDGTILLLEKSPQNYKIRSPGGFKLLPNTWVYDIQSDTYGVRVAGAFLTRVYETNAIVKHADVNLA